MTMPWRWQDHLTDLLLQTCAAIWLLAALVLLLFTLDWVLR